MDFETVIDLKNGNAHPLCTQKCVIERMEEMRTAKYLVEPQKFFTTINVPKEKCDKDHKKLFESFRTNENLVARYGEIRINYI